MSETEEDLELTTLPGVGPATKSKLNEAGIYSVLDLATAGPMDIAEAVDIDVTKAVELNNKARKKLVELHRLEPDFINAADLLLKRKAIDRVTTGSKNLDELLGGGVESWAMTEFYGEFGSGKCVAGDTNIIYTNDERAHLETIAETYGKYAEINGEEPYDHGSIVPLNEVKVVGYDLDPVSASYLYRERVRRIISIATERGRALRLTRAHKLLTVTSEGLRWVEASNLRVGDSIATPKTIKIKSKPQIDDDDAYFLGLFVAEGSANPLSISNSDDKLVSWMKSYLERKYGFSPTIRDDDGSPGLRSLLLRASVKPLLGELAESNSYTKTVPESVLNGDEDVIRNFLAGYVEGDGHIAVGGLEFSSNSKKLVEALSYLLSRLGIASSLSAKEIETGPRFRMRVAGFDRVKLKGLPFRSKRIPRTKLRNSKYGSPFELYVGSVYKKAISADRWHLRREGQLMKSGTLYELLTRSAYERKGVSDGLLRRIIAFFENRRQLLIESKERLAEVDLDDESQFRRLAKSLPFPLTSLAVELGLSKSGVKNYLNRGLPASRVEQVSSKLSDEISRRIGILDDALSDISEASKFNWDQIVSSSEADYNDYVYDLVVPGKHTFVGGNLPTVMHNTQICHTLCVTVQTPREQGGLNGGAVYIDTEGTFRPERISEIAEARGLKPDDILSRIMVARAYNSAHQELIVRDLGKIIEPNHIKLVILDSAVAHYRAEFVGRGTLAERQQRLNRFMHLLLRVAEVYNVAVVVTNQVQAAPDSFFGDPTRPTGGHVVAHTSTYRVYLRKGGKSRIARMVDSPYHAERDAVFILNEKGIDDPPEETTRKK